MDKEKIIRQQTRQSLRDNWVTAVSALLFIFTALTAIYLIFVIVCIATNMFGVAGKPVTDTFQTRLTSVVVIVIFLLLLFVISPLINGFFRLCYKISDNSGAQFSDTLYFFSSKKLYLQTIYLNTIILIKKFICYFLPLIPFIIFAVLYHETSVFSNLNVYLTNAVCIFLLVCGIVAGMLFSVKYLVDKFIYASGEFENLDEVFCAAQIIRQNHSADIRNLLYTFAGWMLLCFFVLPVLYVAPYFFTSAATSSKWLISIYKEGKMV